MPDYAVALFECYTAVIKISKTKIGEGGAVIVILRRWWMARLQTAAYRGESTSRMLRSARA